MTGPVHPAQQAIAALPLPDEWEWELVVRPRRRTLGIDVAADGGVRFAVPPDADPREVADAVRPGCPGSRTRYGAGASAPPKRSRNWWTGRASPTSAVVIGCASSRPVKDDASGSTKVGWNCLVLPPGVGAGGASPSGTPNVAGAGWPSACLRTPG